MSISAVQLASLLTKSHLLSHLESQSTTSDVSKGTKAVPEATKSDASEVTVADFASQAVLIHAIHSVFPDDVFIAEEGIEMLKNDKDLCDRVWELIIGAGQLSAISALSALSGNGSGSSEIDGSASVAVGLRLPASKEEMLSAIDLGSRGGLVDSNAKSARTWILDPIDGTKTYIRAQQYAVCLCLVDHGVQQVAVLGCPNLRADIDISSGRVQVEESLVDLRLEGGLVVSALSGQGTYISDMAAPSDRIPLEQWLSSQQVLTKTTRPATANDEKQMPLQFTDSRASPHVSPVLHDRVFASFGQSKAHNLWSMQMKYIALTLRAANTDVLIRVPPDESYHASIWDHAGGQLLLTESGGALTDATGQEFRLDGCTRKLVDNWGVCAVRGGDFEGVLTSKQVHNKVLGRVKQEVQSRANEEAD